MDEKEWEVEHNDVDMMTVVSAVSSHHLDAKVYEIVGWVSNDPTRHLYAKRGAVSSDDTTEDLTLAQTIIDATVKWDGCMDVRFGDHEGYVHFCGQRHVMQFLKAVGLVFSMAKNRVPSFDPVVAGCPGPRIALVPR